MILPVKTQIYYFLSTIIAGFGVGIMYDVYRIIRGFNSPKKFMTAVSDLLFWVLAAIITFTFFLYTNYGDLGYYTFLGLSIGLFIYFKLISKRFIKTLRWILYYIFKGFRMLLIFIIYPFKLIRYIIKLAFFKSKDYLYITIRGTKQEIIKIKNKRKIKEGKKKKTKNK
jgi:spore cortex biosynthesis protein YabQ